MAMDTTRTEIIHQTLSNLHNKTNKQTTKIYREEKNNINLKIIKNNKETLKNYRVKKNISRTENMTQIIDKRMLNIILGKLLCSWGILENDDENLFYWVCPSI